jgi:hypothetical protein
MRYLVFAGRGYYPGGGWEDFVGAAETEAAAVKIGRRELSKMKNASDEPWAHYVDLQKVGAAPANRQDRWASMTVIELELDS